MLGACFVIVYAITEDDICHAYATYYSGILAWGGQGLAVDGWEVL